MTKLGSMVSAAAMVGMVAASAVQAQTPTPTTATSTCVGDCKDKMMVDISDLVVGVNIALGVQELAACPAFDCMHNGTVTVTCLVQGVNNALLGCGFITPTPTITGLASPTPTVTPTTAAKLRVFTIDPGIALRPSAGKCSTTKTTQCLADTDCPSGETCTGLSMITRSGLFTSGLSGGNASENTAMPPQGGFPPGPLMLELGAQDANGIAPFTLAQDVTLDISIVDSSRVCIKMMAAGSHGQIDCDGGTPYDVTCSRPKMAPGIAFTCVTGQGSPAGPGNGNLTVPVLFQLVAAGVATPCDQVTYMNPEQDFVFTTTNGTAQVTGTMATLTTIGRPFDCANFSTAGTGLLTAPLPANQAPIGDVGNALRLSETP
jgi:hypothetical protein